MVEIFRTDDGSHSLKDKRTSETYHSHKGAVQESMHVFIQAGLQHLAPGHEQLRILEMGFGTGLNAILTYLHTPPGISIQYTSIEAFPIDPATLQQLDYASFLQADPVLVNRIHQAPFNENTVIGPRFSLAKWHTGFMDFESPLPFDLLYYDAFSPKVQPELWTLDCMQKCASLLRPGGLLVTYCAQGQFRRNLRDAGFSAEKIPGPPGKFEMTRAVKI